MPRKGRPQLKAAAASFVMAPGALAPPATVIVPDVQAMSGVAFQHRLQRRQDDENTALAQVSTQVAAA